MIRILICYVNNLISYQSYQYKVRHLPGYLYLVGDLRVTECLCLSQCSCSAVLGRPQLNKQSLTENRYQGRWRTLYISISPTAITKGRCPHAYLCVHLCGPTSLGLPICQKICQVTFLWADWQKRPKGRIFVSCAT